MPRDRPHRQFQGLALATLLVGLVPGAFPPSASDPAALAGAYFGWVIGMYLFAAGGTLVAGLTFERGDPMRPGWLLLSASFLLLVPGRLAAGPGAAGIEGAPARLAGFVGLACVSSALSVAGFLTLARAWRTSGLDLTAPAARHLLRLAALAVSAVLLGPDLADRIPAAAAGDPVAVADVLTDLLDGALFVVAVPVARAALALGGGLVAWPWVLLTASVLAWLGYDASRAWGAAMGLAPDGAQVLEEILRSLGASATFSAGIAQRWVMQGSSRRA
jgi:hypothetical protein